MTYEELHQEVRDKKIVSAKHKDGRIFRLFDATNGRLCYFPKGKSRRGFVVDTYLFAEFVSFNAPPAPKTEGDKLKKQYAEIAKYKRMAEQATFTNDFIKSCKAIPSFDEWVKDKVKCSWDEKSEPRPKGMYELGITTGNKIDGRVISIDRIAKQYPRYAEQLRQAIKEQKESQICSHVPFAGYEMSLSTANKQGSVGEFIGYLSLEYKGCGNGYYYLLINDDNFIGYDVD